MELNEALPTCGRITLFCPALADALGSQNAALLLCQLIYWLGKEAEPERGIYKTKAELTAETSLSAYEQDVATAKLQQLGLLTLDYNRLHHRMYYLLHLDAANAFLANHQASPNRKKPGSRTGKTQVRELEKLKFDELKESRTGKPSVPELKVSQFGNPETFSSGTGETQVRSLSIHETTPETTSGEHTHEMMQASVELAVGFAGLEEWLQREAGGG